MELTSSSTWGVPARMTTGTAAKHLPLVVGRSTQSPFRHRTALSSRTTTKGVASPGQHRLVTCCTRSAGAGGRDHGQAPETDPAVLNTAIKSGDVCMVSDSAGEKCPWASIPLLLAAMAKKRALELFSALQGLLKDNVTLVIRPTQHDGTDVGIACRLDWKKTLPLWKGCSFYTIHTYQGKMFASNVEAIAESIAQSMAFKLIMMGCLGPALNKIVASKFLRGEDSTRRMLLVLLLAVAATFVLAKVFTHNS